MADDLKIHLLTKPADRWVAVHIAHPWALKTDCSQGVQWLHIASVWATWLHSEPLYWVHLWIYRIIQRRLLDDIYCGCWPWTVSKMLKHDAPNLVSNSYVLIKCECQRAAALITTTKVTPQDLTADRKTNKQTKVYTESTWQQTYANALTTAWEFKDTHLNSLMNFLLFSFGLKNL